MKYKKRIVIFEIASQGRVFREFYELSPRDNADKVGQALVVWFNATGGNNDGSYRRFLKTAFDETHSVDSWKEVGESATYPYFPGTVKRFDLIRPITVLSENYEKLLSDDYKKYRGN